MTKKAFKKAGSTAELTDEEFDHLIQKATVHAGRLLSGKARYSAAPMNSKEIAELRKSFGLSQTDFAWLLNVSVQTVQGWEQGVRVASGAALKLLYVIRRYPELLLKLL